MMYESEHDEMHDELHSAFDAAVTTLVVGASPNAEVMRDGAARRTRRRLAVTSGVTALAVLPIAAVAVFAGGAAGTNGGSVSAATGSATSGAKTYPAPIVVPTPLPAPGQLNPAKPNDSIVVLASGTAEGKPWRLVRDRFVVAGPEPKSVLDDPSSRPHLPYTANWGKSGTIECDFTGIQWGDGALGDPGAGSMGRCNPTDDGSVATLARRFDWATGSYTLPNTPTFVAGRIDGTDAAYITVDVDGRSFGKQPVIEVPGEQNDYYAVMLPHVPAGAKFATVTVYDAQGHVLGSDKEPGMTRSTPTPGKSTGK